jgi:hypothetical protein
MKDADLVETKAYTDLSSLYATQLKKAMEQTEKQMMRDILYGTRASGVNEYIHGIQREATADSKATAAVK